MANLGNDNATTDDRGVADAAELGGLQGDSTINDDAARFLDRLDPSAGWFSFRTFPDKGTGEGCNIDGGLDNKRWLLEQYNREGRGVFVVINFGGHKATHIKRIRAVFADLDGAPLDPVLACELKPHMIVESSPGKWHAYWLVIGLEVTDFKPVQHRIAERFGSDEAVDDLPRVMRLPGFLHQKGEPFRSSIVQMNDAAPYSAADILRVFPPLAMRPSKSLPATPTVATGRHADVLKTTARAAKKVARGEATRTEAMHELHATRDAGRWSRAVPDDELHRAFDGALMKFGHDEWSTTPPHGDAHNACSHVANGHRFAKHYRDHALYVEGVGWHHRTTGRWQHDELAVRALAQGLGKIIAAEAASMASWVADAPDIAERKQREAAMAARFKWAGQSEQSAVIDASLRQAEPLMRCKAADMDADADVLGMPTAVLDLRAVSWRPYTAADRITKACAIDFDMHAVAPRWRQFITETFADPDLSDFVQRLAGYCLSGHRGEHLLPILHGSGANGKSVFLGTLQHVLGEYASTAAPGLLIRQPGSEHPTGLADLQGRRLVVVSETGEGGRLNEELVKSLSGGDAVTARRMRMDFYQFSPTHQIICMTNHKPRVTGSDEGIWRRLRLVPFDRIVPAEQRDTRLAITLKTEAAGILAWCVEGWRKYQSSGMTTPRAVSAATKDYRTSSDMIGAFIDEACEVGPYFTTPSSDLYAAYKQWCEEAGEYVRSQRELSLRLGERGFEQARIGKARRWRGLRPMTQGDGYGPDSGLCPTRDSLSSGYTEISPQASCRVTADDYRRAKDGG